MLNREASATSAEVILGKGPLEEREERNTLIKLCRKVSRLLHYIVSLARSLYSLVPRPLSSGGEGLGDEAETVSPPVVWE